MGKNEEKIENDRLTLLEMGFLTELEKLDRKRGAVELISKKFGFVHSKVSRFFKSCVERGLLTEELKFTEKGQRILEWNQALEKDIRNYLLRTGVTRGINEMTKALFENVDYEILRVTIASYPKIEADVSMNHREVATDVRSIMSKGRHMVRIGLFQQSADRKARRSMEESALGKYAWLVYNDEESYLELTFKEMTATSRLTGKMMTGRLTSLKYLSAGVVHSA